MIIAQIVDKEMSKERFWLKIIDLLHKELRLIEKMALLKKSKFGKNSEVYKT